MIQRFFRSGAPFGGKAEPRGYFAEIFQRPAFPAAAGERVNGDEVLHRRRRDRNPRDSFLRWRKRGEKCEREMANGVAKLGTVGAVPGIDRVERFKLRDTRVFDDAEKIESGIGDGAGVVGETDQRQQRTRGPDFGVGGACSFQSGQREDDVPDGAGADQKSTADRRQDRLSYREILTGSVRSTVLGGRHIRSSQA